MFYLLRNGDNWTAGHIPAAGTSQEVAAKLPQGAEFVTFSAPVSGQVPTAVNWSTGAITWGEPPVPTDTDFDAELSAIDDRLKAIVRWIAQARGITMQEAIAELRPIYRAIRRQ